MSSEEKFNALLDALYGAAVDPAIWSVAHERYVEFLGADLGHMSFFDWTVQGGGVVKGGFTRIDPAVQQLLVDPHWQGRDPWLNVVFADRGAVARMRTSGGAYQGIASIPFSDYEKTEFYQEVGRLSEARDHLTVACTHAGRLSVGFGAHTRSRDGFSARQRADAEAVLPHLRRALDIYSHAQTQTALIGGRAIWDSFSSPVLIFRNGRCVYANPAAERALEDAHVLTGRAFARPRLADADADGALDAFIACGGRADGPLSHAAVVHARDGERWLLQLVRVRMPPQPLTALLGHEDSAVIATLTRLAEGSGRRAAIAGFTGLTPAERDVLALIADGLSPGEIAARTARSVETVRSHVKSLQAKLDARGVADLARIAGLLIPVDAGGPSGR